MKGAVSALLRVGIVSTIMATLFIGRAMALNAVPPEPILTAAPLYITGYQRADSGTTLQFVELYNSGSSILNLAHWSLSNGTQTIASLPDVFLEPGNYVIVSNGAFVENASLQLSFQASTPSSILKLLPPSKTAYAETQYDLKQGDAIFWQRTTTQTGYSSSTSSFVKSLRIPYDGGLYQAPSLPVVRVVEVYPYSSDCAPNDESVLCSDYVKLHNPTDREIALDDIVVRTDSSSTTRTAANTVSLDGVVIAPNGYHTVWLTDAGRRLSLTNSGGYIWLEDKWELARYDNTMTKYESAATTRQGFAWALAGDGNWSWTSTPQPAGRNVFTMPSVTSELSECPVGKYRNPETNRCRSIEEAVNALATCPEGQYRNPETNRCRSNTAATSASLTPCKEGQERNPATNRCRSIASAIAELIPCDEGYERNPATNRCRKIKGAEMNSAVGIAQTNAPSSIFSPYLIAAILATGVVGYAVYEWRSEIANGFKRVATALGKK